MTAVLRLEGVRAGYVAGIDILDGVDLRVEPGTITGIIGPNGAGKSTLLRTVFGFLRPHRGRIVFADQEIQGMSPHAIKRRGVSYVTQSANIFPQLTVDENLRLGAWVIRRDRRRVAGLLDRAWRAFPPLAARRGTRATALSGGQAKMLSLAKEAMTEPRLLLVDEPSAGLAPRVADAIYSRLLDARAAGLTVLLVDQNIAKAVDVCDYLYLLERGQVRREGPRESFASHLRDIIRDALLGA